MRHGSLFSGIGGFDLAAEWCGWENIFQVETDKFCQKVLVKNFPNTKKYEDIRQFDGKEYKGKIDILTGGFPCQSFSVAGKGGCDLALWKEMLRIIKEIKPEYVVAENVLGLLSRFPVAFEQVCADLENTGYEVQPLIIPACGINAPHRRDRIWILAHTNSFGFNYEQKEFDKISQDEIWELQIKKQKRNTKQCRTCKSGFNSISANTSGVRSQRRQYEKEKELQREYGRFNRKLTIPDWGNFPASPALCRKSDGVSDRVDRIKALGNAIVPQIALQIFKSIEKFNEIKRNNLLV